MEHKRIQKLGACGGAVVMSIAVVAGLVAHQDHASGVVAHPVARIQPASTPVIAECIDTITDAGHGYLNHCRYIGVNQAAVTCARAAFLADDYAHTHTGGAAERRAIKACSRQVGGF